MKPNALRFGAVGTLPLISAGKPIPGAGQVPDSAQALSHLMVILLPFPAVVRTTLPENVARAADSTSGASLGSKMEIPS